MISKEELKSLKTIHISMCVGLCLFVVVSDFLIRKNGNLFELDDEMMYVLQTFVFLGFLLLVPLGYRLHSKKLDVIRNQANPANAYRNSYVVKLVFIQFAGFLSGVVYLLSANTQILIIAAMGLVLLAINHPTSGRVERELELELPEQEEIEE